MNLFVLLITYQKPFEEIEKILQTHRAFLGEYYAKGILLVSGPQNPKIGGVVIGKFADKESALEFTKLDPFVVNEVATYEIIEFTPVKKSEILDSFI